MALHIAASPTAEEMAAAKEWIAAHLGPDAEEPPFSFMYGGKRSDRLFSEWQSGRTDEMLDHCRTQHTLTYSDPETGLQVRCVAVEYQDFPTVEWTVYLKNMGSEDSPFLDRIHGLDVHFDPDGADEFTLHHHVGSPANRSDYAPMETRLPPDSRRYMNTSGGRSTNSDWPYFNVEWGGQGRIVVVGWPAQWAAEFVHRERTGLRVRAGQELTHLKLRPGEEIRTPLILIQFWKGGDRIRSQNTWRRWMLRHNLPRPVGRLPAPLRDGDADVPTPMYSAASCSYTRWMYRATEENQKHFIDRFLGEEIDIDSWWMDTGWYVNNGMTADDMTDDLKALHQAGRLWEKTGIWEVNRHNFPNGLRAISDHAHRKGLLSIVWFEPERISPPAWTTEAHPEWCLTASTHPHRLLNLGHPDARRWLDDRIERVLTEEAIDVYRVDFNFDPLDHWRQNDTHDRQGILENHYAQGFLAHWDEMLRRNPELLIDTCASGGRRNDLETLRRSVPLWRSDRAYHPISMQCHTYGISSWVPYSGLASDKIDAYRFRSCMYPAIHAHCDVRREDIDYDLYRALYRQWREVAPNYMGDYYPLTPYSTAEDTWIAWQFDRPEAGTGMIQAFRRDEAEDGARSFQLHGLDPEARYEVTDYDASRTTTRTGHALM